MRTYKNAGKNISAVLGLVLLASVPALAAPPSDSGETVTLNQGISSANDAADARYQAAQKQYDEKKRQYDAEQQQYLEDVKQNQLLQQQYQEKLRDYQKSLPAKSA